MNHSYTETRHWIILFQIILTQLDRVQECWSWKCCSILRGMHKASKVSHCNRWPILLIILFAAIWIGISILIAPYSDNSVLVLGHIYNVSNIGGSKLEVMLKSNQHVLGHSLSVPLKSNVNNCWLHIFRFCILVSLNYRNWKNRARKTGG